MLLQLVLSPHSLFIAKLLICVSLTSHTHMQREKDIEPGRSVQPLFLCDSYIISHNSGAILLLSVVVCQILTLASGLEPLKVLDSPQLAQTR